MDQKITIKIAERSYILKASTPEYEELIRLAAADVNKKIVSYAKTYPGKSLEAILSFISLNECITRLAFQRKLEAEDAALGKLISDTESYLESAQKE